MRKRRAASRHSAELGTLHHRVDCEALGVPDSRLRHSDVDPRQPGTLPARGLELRAGGAARAFPRRRPAPGSHMSRLPGSDASCCLHGSRTRGTPSEQATGAPGGPAQGHPRAHGSRPGGRGRNGGRHPDQHPCPDVAGPCPAAESRRSGLHGRPTGADSPCRAWKGAASPTPPSMSCAPWWAVTRICRESSAPGQALDLMRVGRTQRRKRCCGWRCATPASRNRNCSSRLRPDTRVRRRRTSDIASGGWPSSTTAAITSVAEQILSDRRRDKAFESAGWTS